MKAPCEPAESAHPRKTRGNNLLHVVIQPQRRQAPQRGSASGEQVPQAHGRLVDHSAFGHGHGSHSRPPDAAGTGVRRSAEPWDGATTKQELPTGTVCVDRPPHDIPHLGDLLPLIDQHWASSPQNLFRLSRNWLTNGLGGELGQSEYVLLGRRALPDAFRPVDGLCSKHPEQLVELIVQDRRV